MQTLNKIGELTKILSVKSETCDSIIHFMACFGIGRILGELFRETRKELFELTQWRRTLEIIKNLLSVLAIKLLLVSAK